MVMMLNNLDTYICQQHSKQLELSIPLLLLIPRCCCCCYYYYSC